MAVTALPSAWQNTAQLIGRLHDLRRVHLFFLQKSATLQSFSSYHRFPGSSKGETRRYNSGADLAVSISAPCSSERESVCRQQLMIHR